MGVGLSGLVGFDFWFVFLFEGALDVRVTVFGSKSVINWVFMVVALVGGSSWLFGALLSDDIEVMIDSLCWVGWVLDVYEDGIMFDVVGWLYLFVEGVLCVFDACLLGIMSWFLVLLCAFDGCCYWFDGVL